MADHFKITEVIRWDLPAMRLPDTAAVALFLRGRGLSDEQAFQHALFLEHTLDRHEARLPDLGSSALRVEGRGREQVVSRSRDRGWLAGWLGGRTRILSLCLSELNPWHRYRRRSECRLAASNPSVLLCQTRIPAGDAISARCRGRDHAQ